MSNYGFELYFNVDRIELSKIVISRDRNIKILNLFNINLCLIGV